MSIQTSTCRLTLPAFKKMKQGKQPIVALTAYDYSFAYLLDQSGVDIILVGDSLGMVIQGHQTTIPVSMEDMLYHTSIVSKGVERALLIMDMPFMSYPGIERALDNATDALQQAGAHMVKLEGGLDQIPIVKALSSHEIPVCAHIGLKPQSIYKAGSYRVQGRSAQAAEKMIEEAAALEKAGADLLLLECVPKILAAEITANTEIPVIGIGAGNACDGQILVLHDLLGITPGKVPKFAKNFMQESPDIQTAIRTYVDDVRSRKFPAEEHSFS
ncbi:MAG TPA: 3-methyl-2-oxobutanoate hydroxymethyltransferase [Gammaproteobacteria bacterium]|nr:3-methyl-2-oxobutanoate hydroxymethyltransferase [Gammaproteobacteria bacterium]